MGTEMIAKATDSFERKQRRCLELLDEPTLFTGVPKLSLALVATPREGHAFTVGDECRLALDANRRLVVVQGVSVVGHIEDPPSSVIDMMLGPCPSAFGLVSRMFTLTGKAEVQLE